MKVTNLFKDKVDAISAHQSEFMNWMSPTLRDYWSDFLGKAQNSFLFSKVRDHQQQPSTKKLHLNLHRS